MTRMPGADQLVLVVQLDELVSRARPIAVLLRLLDEGIAQVSRQPAGAAFGSGHLLGTCARICAFYYLCRGYRPGSRR